MITLLLGQQAARAVHLLQRIYIRRAYKIMSNTHYRSHGAHVSKNSSPTIEDVPPGELPSHVLQPESEHIRGLLEQLDDVIFSAITGHTASLAQARTLWPQILAELGWQQVEESREQYVRYAIDVTQRCDRSGVRSPEQAIAALEIISLLTKE